MSEANGWAAQFLSAGRIANQYNKGPGIAHQLAGDLVHAQGEAVILGLDLGDGSSSESADQARLVTDLKSAAADCGSRS
jgi:hypothetical protein